MEEDDKEICYLDTNTPNFSFSYSFNFLQYEN